jgi:predicted dehydrogenase
MLKLAILGCENSHANTFIDFVVDKKVVDDVEFIGVYSEDAEAMAKLTDKYGIPGVDSVDAFVGKVDGIIITARNGANHYKYAKPYIESGIPMFIDKPITNESSEAVEFMRDLKAHGVKISGGSCLMYANYIQKLKEIAGKEETELFGGHFSAPMSYENAYGGFPFYAQHLVQMVTAVFGNKVNSLHAFKNGKAINIVFHYDKFNVTAEYVDRRYNYYASVSTAEGIEFSEFNLDGTFLAEFMEYYNLLKGNIPSEDYSEFIVPVFIINAIERAIVSGKEEPVGAVEV